MNGTKIAAGELGRRLCIALVAVAAFQSAKADEIRIKMLDTTASGPLAFEPGFVKAKVGDTIIFEPMTKGGHSSVSLLVPAGAHAWSGAADKEMRVTLDTDGIYLYACVAHKMMGMVGVIQVGKPVNLEEANRAASMESAKFVMNKDRFEKELAQVK
ncbi:plastocyanin/azurin family copper-binding protein [Hydrogenophaga sp. PAMC20947]|uniref:plastocyanin/azurin family copper-binding protein n=1 Tax=Hydrogenophaga sp. PAMC20947 TaxID=2565558 RepID=UPI00109DA890|nr:plastocyanin/azurin family copper-binding protein [Hydrogenophaga sp. PAMC20947]QCB47050.1 pseudoazurin [Hydrogenophaga sp. PAMC20947]